MALTAVVVTALAELVMVARLVTLVGLSRYGWDFVADRKLFTTILIAIPAAAALVMSLPRLLGLTTSQEAAASGILLPLQVASFASLGGFFEKYLPPHRPLATNLLVFGMVVAVTTAFLAARLRWRAHRTLKARALFGVATVIGSLVLVSALTGYASAASRLPGTYAMMQGSIDTGGGPTAAAGHHHGGSGAVSMTSLAGPREGEPDKRFTLAAQHARITLSSGAAVDAWTFNGQAPGPELRVREGELVEITLVNRLPEQSVTIHWRGVDVPNGEDGVPAVTQDAVAMGDRHTYRFKVGESGTRWYHSHQAGSEQVLRGLFGSMVIDPVRQARQVDRDVSIMLHDWDLDADTDTDEDRRPAFDTLQRQAMPAGSRVRLRLTNTSHLTKTISLSGTRYQITALDGTDLNAPADIEGRRVTLGAAQRVDFEFTMPAGAVRLVDHDAPDAGMLWSPDGTGEQAAALNGAWFAPLSYGAPNRTEFDLGSKFDRSYNIVLDEQYGSYNGAFVARMTVNGQVFPHAPMHMVRQGDLVRMRFVNRGDQDHPMHIHGHHFLVLTRNGKPPTGSPVWLDTVNVAPGEIWEIGFRADNPGIWMDHCHNFNHARKGMVLHLAYDNVTTPFLVGGDAQNQPH